MCSPCIWNRDDGDNDNDNDDVDDNDDNCRWGVVGGEFFTLKMIKT